MAEHVAVLVLGHHVAEIGADPEIGPRNRFAVHALDRKAAQHDDAEAFGELMPHVVENGGEAWQRELVARDLDETGAGAPRRRHAGGELVDIGFAQLVAAAPHVAQRLLGPAGRIDHRLSRLRRTRRACLKVPNSGPFPRLRCAVNEIVSAQRAGRRESRPSTPPGFPSIIAEAGGGCPFRARARRPMELLEDSIGPYGRMMVTRSKLSGAIHLHQGTCWQSCVEEDGQSRFAYVHALRNLALLYGARDVAVAGRRRQIAIQPAVPRRLPGRAGRHQSRSFRIAEILASTCPMRWNASSPMPGPSSPTRRVASTPS